MAVIKCENGHYYDNSKHETCPHCLKMQNDQGESSNKNNDYDIGENKTIAINQKKDSEDYIVTQSLRNMVKATVDESQKTVGIISATRNSNPISGWLVCIEGENKGRSYEIHLGKNYVGRSMNNDIHINDRKVSRDNHFTLIYEPMNIEFYVLQGNGITYHNGEFLSDADQLTEGDTIEVGSSKYIFVPFCKEGRDWND